MAAMEVDVPRVASFASLSQDQVDKVLTAPTTELVRQLLATISKKAKEFEESASSRLKLRVELENANRTHEAKQKSLKNSLDKATEANTKLKEELKTSETLKQSITAEIDLVRTSTVTSDSESNTLRSRISALENSQRDSAILLEKKSAAYDDLAGELSAKHQKTVELRKEIASLDQNLSTVNSKSNSWKIREQELAQEADTLKTHNEWLDQELKTRNAEHSKFRKEKNARLSEVQQQYEDATSNIEALRRTEQLLRGRLQEVTQKSEEYLQQVQTLRDESSRNEENFRAELDTANRLAELLQESLDTEKQRVQDLSEELEDNRQRAADEVGQMASEIDAEHEERLEAEKHVAELEVEIERLRSDAEAVRHQEPMLSTPKPKLNGSHMGTPRNGSPIPGSRGGLNYTQLVSDYHSVKTELDAERRRTEQLSATLEEIMRDIELRQPEINALRVEHTRLENEVITLTANIDSALQDREAARQEIKNARREMNGLSREGELLRQQLRDLSSQIKVLLMEVHAASQGSGELSREQRTAFEALALGDLDGDGAAPVSDTHHFISEHLVTFRSIQELQEHNSKLLRLTRELGEQMEGEEAQQEKAQVAQDREDLLDLRSKFQKAKDEIKILTTQSNSFIKERDMFRRMLTHRGKLPQGDITINFGESINGSLPPSTPARQESVAPFGSPSSRELTDLTKAIKELQSQYDAYRNDAAQHQKILKQQTDTLAQQNSDLRNEVSKKTNETTLATDRYELLQGNYGMLKSENQELQRRSQSLSEHVAKQEITTSRITEDLVESKSIAESLRNEASNLKAEKDFWKTVEKRLNEELANAMTERDRLNALNTDMQSILNEKEHNEAEFRRRVQLQLENAETDLQATRKKLDEEIEESKRAISRREFDAQQGTRRVEELMTTLSTVREDLAATRSTKDHLQSRVDELVVELRNAQETLEVYRPRPAAEEPQSAAATEITKEQALTLEVSELKRELEVTRKELTDTKALMEQFKSISQHAEEELQAMNETYDQYRQETDAQIEESSQKVTQLEETIENLRTELQDINRELLAANERGSEHSQIMDTQKSTYESELLQLRDSIERARAAVQYHQEDLRKQAEIAQQAQENYDHELLKHAEAARSLQVVRAELSQIKIEVLESRAAAETAETKFQQSEESWTEAKERYERELSEIRSRKDDAAGQNRLLHAQLESVNRNMGELRQKRVSDVGMAQAANGDTESNTQNLNELVSYLQKEKTIVDTQYLRAQQESKRLQQQLEHTQTLLDEVRLKLVQEQKSREIGEQQTLNHNKLMETLQELNLYRESNSTLRLEKKALEINLTERSSKVEELQAQILPLQSRISELEEAKEMLETDVRMASEAKDRFEKRYLDILNRSNAVDPAEFEEIKQKLNELETERAQLVETRDSLQQQVDSYPTKLQEELEQQKTQNDERLAKFRDQAKEKNRTQVATIREKDIALQTAVKEKDDLSAQLLATKEDLGKAVADKDSAEAALATRVTDSASTQQAETEEGQIQDENLVSTLETIRAQLADAESRIQSEIVRYGELTEQLATVEQTVSQLQTENASLKEALDHTNAQLSELETRTQAQVSAPEMTNSTTSDEANTALQASLASANAKIEEMTAQLQTAPAQVSAPSNRDTDAVFSSLQSQLRLLESEAEELRSKLQAFESAKEISSENAVSVVDQIASQIDAIRVDLTRKHEERIKLEEDRFKKRADKMKEALNKQIIKLKDEGRSSLSGPTQETLDNLVQAHNDQIQAINAKHAEDVAALQQQNQQTVASAPAAALSEYSPTEEQVRDLLKNNTYARKLVSNSMDNRAKKILAEEQGKTQAALQQLEEANAQKLEAQVKQLRDLEQQKREAELKGVDERIKKARDEAEAMTKKKFDVKFSMTENRLNMAVAKVNYVQNAAKDTPNETVAKVWEVAKDLKAPPKPAANPAAASTTQANQAPGSSTAETTPAAAAVSANPSTSSSNTGVKAQPGVTGQAKSTTTSGQTTGIPQASGLRRPSGLAQIPGQPAGLVALGLATPASQAPASGMAQSQHARGGRGGSAIPRGGSMRGRGGSSIPALRGGKTASGGGARSIETINTANAATVAAAPAATRTSTADGSDSPKTPMNPAAAQFMPGQKRGLEGSDNAGDEKRTKTE